MCRACIVVVLSLQHKRVFSRTEVKQGAGWRFEGTTMALQVFFLHLAISLQPILFSLL